MESVTKILSRPLSLIVGWIVLFLSSVEMGFGAFWWMIGWLLLHWLSIVIVLRKPRRNRIAEGFEGDFQR